MGMGLQKNLEGSRFFSLLGGVRPCLSETQTYNRLLAHVEDYKVKIGPIHSMKAYRTSRKFVLLIYKVYTSVGSECFSGILIS
jgi:hypothetical protein